MFNAQATKQTRLRQKWKFSTSSFPQPNYNTRYGATENFKFPGEVWTKLWERLYDRRKVNKKEEKALLVKNLEAFDSVSNNKPVFFALIHSKYKGNIRRYVNAMYRKSFLLNLDRLNDLYARPRAKTL